MNRPTNKPTTHGWRRWLALWGVCCSLAATAQTSVEYFWDNDPGYGKATSVVVTPSNDVATVNFDVSVEDLSEGVHRFCFRSYDEGGWSPTVQYYVRVESGEPQLITAIEYFWDEDPGFGNGTPINFNPATAVDLSEYVLDVNGMTGDHLLCIRAKSKGGWSPLLTQVIACTAEGNYTLNAELEESVDRNFQSLDEMFTVLSTRHVSGDVKVTVCDGASFTYDATQDGALEMLTTVAEDLNTNKARITFASTSSAIISITADEEDVADVIALCVNISLDNVTLEINDVAYDFSLLGEESEEICSGSQITAREWSKMSKNIKVSWTAAATDKADVKGYTESGTDDLSSLMTLTNTGSAKDYVTYTVSLSYGETKVHTFTYTIYVNPSVVDAKVSFTSSTPTDNAIVNPGQVTIQWNKVSGATSYEVTVDRIVDSDDTKVTTTENLTTNTTTINAETGYSYIYKVRAIGPCDYTVESSRTLITFRANAEDVNALKVLYEACGGTDWSKQWQFDAKVLQSSNYPGVTFNAEGRVTAIDLTNSGVTGTLPTEGFVLPSLTKLNLSRNQLTGDVPANFVSGCTALTSLNLSYNQLTEVKAVLPSTITSLDLTYQHRVYNADATVDDLSALSRVEMKLNETFEQSWGQSTLMRYNHAKDWSAVPNFALYDKTLSEKFAELKYDGGYYRLGTLNYTQQQNAELIMLQTSGTAKGSVQPVKVSFVEADANVDQKVDVKDVQHTLNYVVAEEGAEGLFNWSAANTFDDELINIQDVVVTVNRVLENTNATAQARARRMTVAERAKAHGRLYVEDGYLCLEADTAVAALDVELQGTSATQIRLILLGSDWQMMSRATDEGVRLVIFSPTGQTLPKGTTQLLALRADKVSPIAAEAADAKARSLTIGVEGGNATGLNATELVEALTAYLEDATLAVESTMECEGVTLTLYDPAGRQLVQYADVALQAGSNVWSVGTAQQGIYLLQVRMANGTTDVIRIAAK